MRDPRIADKSLSNGFESDNNSDGSDEEPYTTARFCNVTLIGPMGQDAAFYNQSASTENPGAYINAGEIFPNNGSASFRQACKSGATRASVYTIRS